MVNLQDFTLRAREQLAESCKNVISLSEKGYSTAEAYAEIRSRQQVLKTIQHQFYLSEEQVDEIINHYATKWDTPLQNLIIKTYGL